MSKSQIDQHMTEIEKNIFDTEKKAVGYIVRTIYFGGGTPSCVDPKHIQNILSAILQSFVVCENPEISIECNPNNITSTLMEQYKSFGINRISIGVQSFYDEVLKKLGRKHNVKTAVNAIDIACKYFKNVSIDLIHSIPDCKPKLPRKILSKIQHLSCYSLTSDKFEPVDDERSIKEQMGIERKLAKFGLEKYEVSNFAKKGMICKHNMAYWTGGQWLGFGESAQSWFDKPWSKSDLIMLGLRLTQGLGLNYFNEAQIKQLKMFCDQGLLQIANGKASCTARGFLLLNHILSKII